MSASKRYLMGEPPYFPERGRSCSCGWQYNVRKMNDTSVEVHTWYSDCGCTDTPGNRWAGDSDHKTKLLAREQVEPALWEEYKTSAKLSNKYEGSEK